MAIGTNDVLTSVLDAESRQRLTNVIDKRSLRVSAGQIANHQ